jgi:hypothetical protein
MDHEKTSAFHLENPGNAKPAKRESPQAGTSKVKYADGVAP